MPEDADAKDKEKAPESNSSTLDDLIDELARVLHEPATARMIVLRSGFPPGDVPAFDVPRVFWCRVIRAAANGKSLDGVQSIVEAVSAQFPGNSFLAQFRANAASPTDILSQQPRRLMYVVCITAILAVPLAIAITALVNPALTSKTRTGFPGNYHWYYSGNLQTLRGGESEGPWNTSPVYSESSRLLIKFEPEEPIYEPIDIVAFAENRKGNKVRLSITPQFSQYGEIEIDDPVGEVGLSPGEWMVVFVIGRRTAIPSTFDELSNGDSQDYQFFRGMIIVASDAKSHPP